MQCVRHLSAAAFTETFLTACRQADVVHGCRPSSACTFRKGCPNVCHDIDLWSLYEQERSSSAGSRRLANCGLRHLCRCHQCPGPDCWQLKFTLRNAYEPIQAQSVHAAPSLLNSAPCLSQRHTICVWIALCRCMPWPGPVIHGCLSAVPCSVAKLSQEESQIRHGPGRCA